MKKGTWIKISVFSICILIGLLTYFNWPLLTANFSNHDQAILHDVNNGRVSAFDSFFILVTNTSSYVALAAIAIVFLWSYVKRSTVLRRSGWQLLLTFLLAFVVIKSLKYSIDRTRPFDEHTTVEQLVEIDTPSFPSGHTLESAAMATAIVLLFTNKALWAFAISWAMSVAFSRILLGVHYPSDVMAGIILGILVALTCHWTFLKRYPASLKHQTSKNSNSERSLQ